MQGGKPAIWAAGDGSGGSTKDGFLGYDMCWTGYWLLKWRAAQLPGSEGILPRCQQLAQFLIAHQATDGMLPTRFARRMVPSRKSCRVPSKRKPARWSSSCWNFTAQDRNPSYLQAARQGIDFLERQVIPLRQWYDYETFWSCSPRKRAV